MLFLSIQLFLSDLVHCTRATRHLKHSIYVRIIPTFCLIGLTFSNKRSVNPFLLRGEFLTLVYIASHTIDLARILIFPKRNSYLGVSLQVCERLLEELIRKIQSLQGSTSWVIQS